LTLPENQLPDRAHEPGCSKPRSTPWYTRGRNREGKRTWTLGILTCPECGKAVMQAYRVNLTKKQKEKLIGIPMLPKFISENNYEIPTDPNEFILWEKKWKIIQVIGFQKQQRATKPMYKERNAFGLEYKRTLDIRRLAIIYKNDEKEYPNLKGRINWDLKLIKEFLDIRPRNWEMNEVISWPPLYRWNIKKTNAQRGRLSGKNHSDCYAWGPKLEPSVIGSEPNDWEKLVIAEADGRMKLMRFIIRLYKESKIQIQEIQTTEAIENKEVLKPSLEKY
jgi:hypothetical protein